MGLPVPLAVQLSTSRARLRVTRHLRDLWFRETAIGGYAAARISLDRSLQVDPDEIRYYGNMYVHDERNGQTVWEGRQADPGRGASGDGTVWQLAAEGPAAHASDRRVPLIYIDRDLTSSLRVANVVPGGQASVTAHPIFSTEYCLLFQFPTGLVIATGDHISMRYSRIRYAGQKLARVEYSTETGITDANEQTQAIAVTGTSLSGDTADSRNWNTATGLVGAVVGTNFTDGRDGLILRVHRSAAAATVPNDDFWAAIRSLVIRAMLKDAIGNDITTGYGANTVLAHEVVRDLLGRLLPQYDGANATIGTATFAIQQLAYPDGVTAAGVFEDLLRFEPGFRWGAYETNPATGKHRFEFVPWSTTVRYEAAVSDDFDSPGSSQGLFSAASVRWRDINGDIRITRRTSAVPELDAAGLVREDIVDLGDEIGATSAMANRAGDQWLAEHSAAPNAGRLTISRPIQDHLTGRMVMPWEIKAGELIRVRGVNPRPDFLNTTDRNGVTIFRIWAKEYSISNVAATLELDSYPHTVAHALAEMGRRPVTRRR